MDTELINKKLAVGMVLYQPKIEIQKKLKQIVDSGFEVFLFDNSPEINLFFCESDNIFYRFDADNPGLGKGMKVICMEAYNKGYKSIIYFDQDTKFTEKTLDYSINFLDEFKYDYSEFSAISIVETNKNSSKNNVFKLVNLIRNSGTIFNLENLKKINWFDETFFVDGVDYEFCLKSLNNNFKIASIGPAPDFDHTSDQGYSEFNLFGVSLTGRLYGYKRLIDIFISSIRIFASSILHLKFFFGLRIIFLMIIFFIYQLLLRFSVKQ